MANSDKAIWITPNTGSTTADPKIVFSGADASTTAQNITCQVYPTNGGTLSFEGSAGQLFSIANNMTGTIFSVNDISGMPSIEVLDSGLVKIAQYSGNVSLGNLTAAYKLHVLGQVGIGQNTNGTAVIDSYSGYAYYGCNAATTGLKIQDNGTATFSGALAATNNITSTSGIIISSQSGFQSATYSAGRNRMWSFANSDGYGISYFQGAGGYGGSDSIGMHFGTATSAGCAFTFSGTGAFLASGDITAYASDQRLKENIVVIKDAINKVKAIRGVSYNWNDLASTFGFTNKETQVGVIAQEIQKVLPEVVVRAPFDTGEGIDTSISGENYLTVKYEKIAPLLIEAIKEQQKEIDCLKRQLVKVYRMLGLE